MSRSTWSPKTYKNQRNRMANTASVSTMLATNISTWNSATRLLLVATRICLDTSLSFSIELYITLMHMVFAKISWNRSWINILISRARFQVTWSTFTTGLFKNQCWTSRGASLSKFARGRTSTGWSRILTKKLLMLKPGLNKNTAKATSKTQETKMSLIAMCRSWSARSIILQNQFMTFSFNSMN